MSGISINISVIPEFSYSVKASLKTYYGKLTPSNNLIVPGEFETMMKSVGCYIRNDYTTQTNRKQLHGILSSSIDCALACLNNGECREGWSYLIGTKECFFLNELDHSILQPGALLLESDYRIGWATGRKSCKLPGNIQKEKK